MKTLNSARVMSISWVNCVYFINKIQFEKNHRTLLNRRPLRQANEQCNLKIMDMKISSTDRVNAGLKKHAVFHNIIIIPTQLSTSKKILRQIDYCLGLRETHLMKCCVNYVLLSSGQELLGTRPTWTAARSDLNDVVCHATHFVANVPNIPPHFRLNW